MKKGIALLLAAVLLTGLLSGCCLSHKWEDATCEKAKTCAECGKTEGEALGHSWQEATCEKAKTCAECGETEGEALGHSWQEATCEKARACANCGLTEGEALGHDILNMTFGKEGFTSPCPRCNVCPEGKIDWTYYGKIWFAGVWKAHTYALYTGTIPVPEGDKIDLREDGTAEVIINGASQTGTWDVDGLMTTSSVIYFTIDLGAQGKLSLYTYADDPASLMIMDASGIKLFKR